MSIKNYKLNLGKRASIEFEAIVNASLQEFLSYRAKKIAEHCNPIAKERLISYAPFLSPIPEVDELELLIISVLPLAFDGYAGDRTAEDLFPAVSIFDLANPAIEKRPKELLDTLHRIFRTDEEKQLLAEALVMQANFFDDSDESLVAYSHQEIEKLIDHLGPKAVLLLGDGENAPEDFASDLHLEGTYVEFDAELAGLDLKLFLDESIAEKEHPLLGLSADEEPLFDLEDED